MVMLKIIPLIISTVITCICLDDIASAQAHSNLVVFDGRASSNQQSNNDDYLSRILLIAGLASGAGLLGWGLSNYRQSLATGSLPHKTNRNSRKILIDRVSPRLRRKLLRLINDPKTANRLLMGIEKNHPQRNPDWIAEKVIYDFQRGR